MPQNAHADSPISAPDVEGFPRTVGPFDNVPRGGLPPMVLDLPSPPRHVHAAGREHLRSGQDLPVEGPDEGTQLTRALPRQGVKHGFEVAAEVDAVAPALEDLAARAHQRVSELSEGAVGQGLPVPERFFRGFGPEAGPLKPTQIGGTRPGEPVDERVPSLPRSTGGKVATQG